MIALIQRSVSLKLLTLPKVIISGNVVLGEELLDALSSLGDHRGSGGESVPHLTK